MRVVVVSPQAATLVLFRGDLMEAMVRLGHEVVALVPGADDHERSELGRLGVSIGIIPLRRAGLNPIHDAKALAALVAAIRRERADVVLAYAPKPVIYGLLAARIAGVDIRAAMITGIGSALGRTDSGRGRLLSRLVGLLYRISLRGAHVVFFQNPDDERLFRDRGMIAAGTTVRRIGGSGVDLGRYAPAPLPAPPLVFLMIGRLLRDKGVREYVEAARIVRRTLPAVRVQLLGSLDVNPTSISQTELDGWQAEGVIEYLGSTRDVRPYIERAHVAVLPSYGEGTPRAVLEAMAMGRPAIVTDVPGCRETVIPGRNGLLVPVRDASALAEAMIAIASDPQRVRDMGVASRHLCEERFDVLDVNAEIIGALGLDARAADQDRIVPDTR